MRASTSSLVCALVAISVALNGVHCKCKKVFERGVTPNEQQTILHKHNQIRLWIAKGKVPGQPKAIKVKRLKWDKYLADAAQAVADLCDFGHKTVNDKRFYVGQNLYKSWSTNYTAGPNWNNATKSWYREHKKYTYPQVGTSAHYTQLVWANTKYIGCGYTHFKNFGRYVKLYVCNYGPGGNIVSRVPYKTRESR